MPWKTEGLSGRALADALRADRMDIARRMFEVLEHRGLGGNELARRFEKVSSAATGWKKGRSQPALEVFAEICRMTGTSADEILGLKDLKVPKPAHDPRKVEQLLRAAADLGRAARAVEDLARRRQK